MIGNMMDEYTSAQMEDGKYDVSIKGKKTVNIFMFHVSHTSIQLRFGSVPSVNKPLL